MSVSVTLYSVPGCFSNTLYGSLTCALEVQLSFVPFVSTDIVLIFVS